MMSDSSTDPNALFCVITTIQEPTSCMQRLSEAWPGGDQSIAIVGDSKGPFEYSLDKTLFLDIETQRQSSWQLASVLPEKHYARKNLGYLEVIRKGAQTIYETDDDNAPMDHWAPRSRTCEAIELTGTGWYNVYRDFSEENIWPRGLPFNHIKDESHITRNGLSAGDSPLQQGLANGSPDVDAIWRLLLEQDIEFTQGASIRLGKGLWCPFNSQSTWWWEDAYPFMYLPYYCPFRMTDIWRSFVAQRCLWELGHELVFHTAEVFQERNPHNPMTDFEDEIPGYLRNDEIRKTLDNLDLKPGNGFACENLRSCYEALIGIDLIPEKELELVDAWIMDLNRLGIR